MSAPIECRGAPRDLGFDQGAACAEAVRAALRGLRRVPGAARVERDLWCHFPHLAERGAGLARGAGVARAGLARALAELGRAGVAAPLWLGGGDGELRLVLPHGLGHDLVLRRSRPDSGYRSLELTLPWLAGSLAGVNEAGLAAAGKAIPGAASGPCAAPALLLLQDALQRCASAAAALEWCLRRPGGGGAKLRFVDAGGADLALRIEGAGRAELRPPPGEPTTSASAPPPLEPGSARVRIDPHGRRLRLVAPQAAELAFEL